MDRINRIKVFTARKILDFILFILSILVNSVFV
jgi:hypothetical protein